jgi:hypothetical protein
MTNTKSLILRHLAIFYYNKQLSITVQLIYTFLLIELFCNAYLVLMTGCCTYFSSCLALSLKNVVYISKFSIDDFILLSTSFCSISIMLRWWAKDSALLRSHCFSKVKFYLFFYSIIVEIIFSSSALY